MPDSALVHALRSTVAQACAMARPPSLTARCQRRPRSYAAHSTSVHTHIRILRSSRWATLLLEALVPPPQPIQLALPFTRLHKT